MTTATLKKKKQPHVPPLEQIEAQDKEKKRLTAEARYRVVAAIAIAEEPDLEDAQAAYDGSDGETYEQFRDGLARSAAIVKQRYRDADLVVRGAEHDAKVGEIFAKIKQLQEERAEYNIKTRKELRKMDILQRWHRNQSFAGQLAEGRLCDTCKDPSIILPERKLINEQRDLLKQIREIEADLKPKSTSGISGNIPWQLSQVEQQIANKHAGNKSQLKRDAKALKKSIEVERAKLAPLQKRREEITIELQKIGLQKLAP